MVRHCTRVVSSLAHNSLILILFPQLKTTLLTYNLTLKGFDRSTDCDVLLTSQKQPNVGRWLCHRSNWNPSVLSYILILEVLPYSHLRGDSHDWSAYNPADPRNIRHVRNMNLRFKRSWSLLSPWLSLRGVPRNHPTWIWPAECRPLIIYIPQAWNLHSPFINFSCNL
jgi:hypothetical protein